MLISFNPTRKRATKRGALAPSGISLKQIEEQRLRRVPARFLQDPVLKSVIYGTNEG